DEDWETGALSVGVAIAGFHFVQAAGRLAAMLGAALAKKLAVGAKVAAALGKTFAVKVALPAIAITGAAVVMMDDETRQNLLAQTGESFRSFREDIQRIWGEEFGEEWRQATRRAVEEGRLFDPITVVVENITETVQAFRSALAPIRDIVRGWVAGIFGDISLSEAFQRGLAGELPGVQIDPRAAALFQSFIDLGGAIGELLMES